MEAAAPPHPPPPPAPAGRRPIEVGRVLSETFSIYANHAAPLLITAFIIFLISGLIQGLLTDGFFLQLIGTIVSLVATALYAGFVVKLVDDVRDGRRDFSVGELISSASPYIAPLILNGILRSIAVGIGLIFLIVPGLYLLTIWAVTSPAIVVENEDGIGAFGRSNRLVAGQRMNVFLTILVVFVLTSLLPVVIALILASVSLGLLIAISIFLAAVLAPITAIVAAVLFFDLRGESGAPAEDRQVVVEY